MTSPLTVDLWRLRRCLETAVPFTSDRDDLPTFNAVHLYTRGGHLVAEATDRYSIGIYRSPVDTKTKFDALIPRDAVRQILSMFKPSRRAWDQTQVELTVDLNCQPSQLRVRSRRGELIAAAELDCKWDIVNGTPAPIERVIKEVLAAKPVSTSYELNPQVLAKFTRVLPKHTPLIVRAGQPHRPILLSTPDDDFLGAIMPMRNHDDVAGPPDYSAWPEYLPAKGDGEKSEAVA